MLGNRQALEVILTTPREMVVVENGVVNCYARIHLKMGALVMIQMGMDIYAAIFTPNLMEQMAHYIILGGITSEGLVRTNHDSYLDGSGQGTGWSPIIWMCLFDILLMEIAANHPGIFLQTPDGVVTDVSTV